MRLLKSFFVCCYLSIFGTYAFAQQPYYNVTINPPSKGLVVTINNSATQAYKEFVNDFRETCRPGTTNFSTDLTTIDSSSGLVNNSSPQILSVPISDNEVHVEFTMNAGYEGVKSMIMVPPTNFLLPYTEWNAGEHEYCEVTAHYVYTYDSSTKTYSIDPATTPPFKCKVSTAGSGYFSTYILEGNIIFTDQPDKNLPSNFTLDITSITKQ